MVDPTFIDTGLESPITDVALALAGLKDDSYHGAGTAVAIADRLAITARHNIEDLSVRLDNYELAGRGRATGRFSLLAMHVPEPKERARIWDVDHYWTNASSDLCLLHLSPRDPGAQQYVWNPPQLQLSPPSVGARVSAFGYSLPDIVRDGSSVTWNLRARTSIGLVRDVHHERRDNSRLPFPCYQTNARYDPAMSGGPVFTDSGHLCGVICSNLPPSAPGEEHVSYVTSLWPVMGILIDLPIPGHESGEAYPALELARAGIISAPDWERVTVHWEGPNTTRTSFAVATEGK